jgi:hypothetical protein
LNQLTTNGSSAGTDFQLNGFRWRTCVLSDADHDNLIKPVVRFFATRSPFRRQGSTSELRVNHDSRMSSGQAAIARDVLKAVFRARSHPLPSGSTVFPLIVSELLDTGTAVAHHKNLAIRLRRIRVHSFILEAHPRT